MLEVVDRRSLPSVICSAQTGVAGSGAERHTRPSQGALRDPPDPVKAPFDGLAMMICRVIQKDMIFDKS